MEFSKRRGQRIMTVPHSSLVSHRRPGDGFQRPLRSRFWNPPSSRPLPAEKLGHVWVGRNGGWVQGLRLATHRGGSRRHRTLWGSVLAGFPRQWPRHWVDLPEV